MKFTELEIGKAYSLMYSNGSLGTINIVLVDVIEEQDREYELEKTYEYDDPEEDDYTYYEDVTNGYVLSFYFKKNRKRVFGLLFGGK